jgi:hypothetical protein
LPLTRTPMQAADLRQTAGFGECRRSQWRLTRALTRPETPASSSSAATIRQARPSLRILFRIGTKLGAAPLCSPFGCPWPEHLPRQRHVLLGAAEQSCARFGDDRPVLLMLLGSDCRTGGLYSVLDPEADLVCQVDCPGWGKEAGSSSARGGVPESERSPHQPMPEVTTPRHRPIAVSDDHVTRHSPRCWY